jgi:hypothetical protein
MLTKSEKFRVIIEMIASNIDSYKPSYHVMTLYSDEGFTDLHEALENYKVLYGKSVQDMMEVAVSDEDWDETDPGPLFYVDETDVNQCFLVIETHLMESLSVAFFADGLSSLIDSEFEDEDV